MKLLPLGLSYPSGEPLLDAIDIDELARLAAGGTSDELRKSGARMKSFLDVPPVFGELEPAKPVDVRNPLEAGWTIVVAAADDRRTERLSLVKPLAEHRGMRGEALVFDGSDLQAEINWIDERYLGLAARPKYLLLLGGPDVLPFGLQAELAAAGASVGRLDFADDTHLEAYVDKVVALEQAADPVTTAKAVVFAADYGRRDPTHYSHLFMAVPIADAIDAKPPFAAKRLLAEQATKAALLDALRDEQAALFYTASHGMFAERASGLAEQKRVNGAICCARQAGDPTDHWMLTAADLPPADEPCCHGGIFIQFACWGYGTPTSSTFDHWNLGRPGINAEEPFIAALPQALLAHPKGPVAYVGHVDTAWLHGFTDPNQPEPDLGKAYDERLEPYVTAVRSTLIDLWPAGLGLDDLEARTATFSVRLATFFDGLVQQGRALDSLAPAELKALADAYIRRNDAMNFLVLGDPAARVRIGG